MGVTKAGAPATATTNVPNSDRSDGGKLPKTDIGNPQVDGNSLMTETNGISDNNNHDDGDGGVNNDGNKPSSRRKLYKSPRFKGYLTLFLSSVVNYQAISVSQLDTDLNTVPASQAQANYGSAVALISCMLTGASIIVHIDRCTCFRKVWQDQLFAPKSRFETLLCVFLLTWWGIATIIQTTVRGVAGDGKNQYNIYYSTWVCFYATYWTLESKMTEYGWPTLKGFVKSWPHRAPGWIGILVSAFFCLLWYVDLYVNTVVNPGRLSSSQQLFYEDIPKSQYQWLVFVAAVSLLPAAGFVFIEIFRNSDSTEKSTSESYIEGFSLLFLVCAWIPSVIVATTPGGFAAVIGNAYVFSWMTTLFVLETSMWFVRDSREAVHHNLEQKDEEYRAFQQRVLEKSHKRQVDAAMRQSDELHRQRSQSRDWAPSLFRRNTLSFGSADGTGREQQEQQQQGKVPSLKTEDVNDSNNERTTGGRRDLDDGDAPHHHFQMNDLEGDDTNNDDDVDDEIRQERMMREADRSAYFDTLADDVL